MSLEIYRVWSTSTYILYMFLILILFEVEFEIQSSFLLLHIIYNSSCYAV